MWQKDLLNFGIKAVKKAVKPMAPMIGRTIKRVGNGQPRVIVKGFGGTNLGTHTPGKSGQLMNSPFLRPVVMGFAGQPGKVYLKPITASLDKARLIFFPNFRTPMMTRHVVYDVRTTRRVVLGFNVNDLVKSKFVTSGTKMPTPNTPLKPPEVATERVVVQGFGGNSANKIYKPIEQNKNTPRTVVKGFLG